MPSCLSFEPPVAMPSAACVFPIDLKVYGPDADKEEIYALRYRAFRASELIKSRTDKRFSDDFDALDSSQTMAAFHHGACVGSFRLTFAGKGSAAYSMPSQTIFPQIGHSLGGSYSRAVEFTRLVIDPDLTNTSFRTTLYATLVRAGLIIAHAGRADFGLIAVNPAHVRFYGLMCGFKEMARAEGYPGIDAPAVLMGGAFTTLDDKRTRQNTFFRISRSEVSDARRSLFPVCAAIA